MALMRVRAAAQLTLPADVRKALNIKEGDYLETEIVDGGVLLKPVALVDRKDAWRRIQSITAKIDKPKHAGGIAVLKGTCSNQADTVVVEADGKMLVMNALPTLALQRPPFFRSSSRRRSTRRCTLPVVVIGKLSRNSISLGYS